MKSRELRVQDPLDARRPARIEASHRTSLNFEVFYFADLESKRKFDTDPPRWCGPLTDPVTGQRFVPARRSPRTEYDGRTFYFVSDESQGRFAARPDSFAVPHFRMREDGAALGGARPVAG